MRGRSGVSTVVGVMLMIVVTVLLAAAVSMYANSISLKNKPPSVEFSAKASLRDENITLTMLSGDTIYKNDIRIMISTDHPATSGYVDMDKVLFMHGNQTNSMVLTPGDVMKIPFKTYGNYAYFSGKEISLSIPLGHKFRVTIIDKDTGQPIWSAVLVMNN